MISTRSSNPYNGKITTKLDFIDKGFDHPIVLVPGWATDSAIFAVLNLSFNYIIPREFHPFDFNTKLIDILAENNIGEISLLGFSLGGFVAAEFAQANKKIVDHLILVGVRKKYKNDELSMIERYLKKNRKGYLYKFYSECFSEKEHMKWFKRNLLKEYMGKFNIDYLLETLDYLKRAKISAGSLKEIKKIRFIHGMHDKIAPLNEVLTLVNDIPRAVFTEIHGSGHIPFFRKNFGDLI